MITEILGGKLADDTGAFSVQTVSPGRYDYTLTDPQGKEHLGSLVIGKPNDPENDSRFRDINDVFAQISERTLPQAFALLGISIPRD